MKDEANSDALNRLLVTCKKCGQSDICRDHFNDHMKNYCARLLLFCSRSKRGGFSKGHNDVDFVLPIMNPSGSLINQLEQDNQRFQNLIKDFNDKIRNLEKEMIRKLNRKIVLNFFSF
jgi:uncharacterized protein YeaO (DUF488 family)